MISTLKKVIKKTFEYIKGVTNNIMTAVEKREQMKIETIKETIVASKDIIIETEKNIGKVIIETENNIGKAIEYAITGSKNTVKSLGCSIKNNPIIFISTGLGIAVIGMGIIIQQNRFEFKEV